MEKIQQQQQQQQQQQEQDYKHKYHTFRERRIKWTIIIQAAEIQTPSVFANEDCG